MTETAKRCGYVAIVGRPNVGKSTLLNYILNLKLSITSRKPQTTRHQILGVKTKENIQSIYVDTPGIHQRRGTEINKYMKVINDAYAYLVNTPTLNRNFMNICGLGD